MDRELAKLSLAGAFIIALGASGATAFAQQPAGATAAASAAEPSALAPAAQEQNGIRYLSGGIGLEERHAMAQVADAYNLRLSFSESEDEHYVADVRVTVRDAQDKVVLELAEAGPLVYVQLPAGNYEVTASHNGVEQVRAVAVGEVAAYFHWPDLPAKG